VLWSVNLNISFGDAPFFVSPARHGEAQDVSGTWNRETNKQKITSRKLELKSIEDNCEYEYEYEYEYLPEMPSFPL
jgi:hypothetical protein